MPAYPRARAPQKRSHPDEKTARWNWRVAPFYHSKRKPAHSNKDPGQPKTNKQILKKNTQKNYKFYILKFLTK